MGKFERTVALQFTPNETKPNETKPNETKRKDVQVVSQIFFLFLLF